MHFRLHWATRIYLPWTHSNSVKLRALLMFLGTNRPCPLHRSSALFLGKGARQLHTCSINPAQHVLALSCSIIWKSFYSLCHSWSALSTQSTVTGIHFGLNFPHTPSESSTGPGCLSFSLIYCSSVRSWKETCRFLLCAAQWPSEDTLAAEHFD